MLGQSASDLFRVLAHMCWLRGVVRKMSPPSRWQVPAQAGNMTPRAGSQARGQETKNNKNEKSHRANLDSQPRWHCELCRSAAYKWRASHVMRRARRSEVPSMAPRRWGQELGPYIETWPLRATHGIKNNFAFPAKPGIFKFLIKGVVSQNLLPTLVSRWSHAWARLCTWQPH